MKANVGWEIKKLAPACIFFRINNNSLSISLFKSIVAPIQIEDKEGNFEPLLSNP